MSVVIYHNPHCAKSRQSVKLLEKNHITFSTRLYLQDALSQAEIRQLLLLLGFSSARELMRIKDATYKELNLADVIDEEQLIQIMAENPKLIERPIVIVDNHQATIARPPERVLELFD